MPAMFGLCVANHVILTITGYPRDEILVKGREKMYDGILSNLQGIEERLAGTKKVNLEAGLRIPITTVDVAYLVEEVFRGRSVVSGLATRLALIRWRMPDGGAAAIVDDAVPGQKATRLLLKDLVCVTKEEALFHEREVLLGGKAPEDVYEQRVVDLVKKRRTEEEGFAMYR
jgi:hypothetical protein